MRKNSLQFVVKSDNEEEDFAKGCQFIQQVKNDVHELFSTYDSKKFVELYKNVFERLNLEMQVSDYNYRN